MKVALASTVLPVSVQQELIFSVLVYTIHRARFIPSGYQQVLWEGSVSGIGYNDLFKYLTPYVHKS